MFAVGFVIVLLIAVAMIKNSIHQRKMQKQELNESNEHLESRVDGVEDEG